MPLAVRQGPVLGASILVDLARRGTRSLGLYEYEPLLLGYAEDLESRRKGASCLERYFGVISQKLLPKNVRGSTQGDVSSQLWDPFAFQE